jgi:HlyD family secretion protein
MGEGIKDLQGLFYIPAKEGNRMNPGMEVFLSPASVKKEDYGYMMGRVVSVSDYPVTYQNMVKALGSEELAKDFSQSGPVVEVYVDVISNSDTVSGYQWTNSVGPAMKINSGTLCDGRIVVSNQKPISMVLPVD